MSLKNLVKRTILSEVKKSDGISENITYIHTGVQPIDVSVIVEYPKFNDSKKDDIVDIIVLHGVDIPFVPKQSDVVILNGARYIIGEFKDVCGLFDISISKTTHNRGR